ncbi:MAG: heparinase II/III family protein [Williamsia sp.]|nr:heparinase II/III family protein [Williamsia sp.]
MYLLKRSLLFFPVLLFVQLSLFAQTDSVRMTELIGHPRLLLLAEEEGGIKRTIGADKVWNGMHQAILAESDNLLTLAPIERIQIGRRLLDKSREALRRLFFLSYAYRMTQQQKYLQRAEKEMLAIAAFTDWNPSHFLDVAEMTMAVSIGYDWCYSQLPAASRATIKEAILKKGLEPSFDPKYNSWLTVTNNWNQVCNAGMSYGAIVTFEDHPELSRTIINRAIKSIRLPMGDYKPDGAYPEGYGYWGYGTSFNVMFIAAIEKLFGKDFGLSAQPGFLKTPGYMENMTGPSGNSFNYSDAGTGGGLQVAMFWFASKTQDPSLLWVERSRLLSKDPKSFTRDRLLPAVMLWSHGAGMNSITAPRSTMWTGKGKNPVALMRTSWSDSSAVWVGMKAGSASVNHAHMDAGSFVMEAQGVRWAMDFGMQDYESLESKGIEVFGKGQNAQRWTIFRYDNLVHNTLAVNGQHQVVDGYAPLTASSSNPQFMHAIADLSEIYKGQLQQATRGVGIVGGRYVVVRDEIQTGAAPTTIRWTLLTPAEAKVTGKNSIELTKDGKKLTLLVQEPATVSLKTWSTDPPHSYDAPNPGTILTGFEVTVPAGTKTVLSVALVPQGVSTSSVQKTQPLKNWSR